MQQSDSSRVVIEDNGLIAFKHDPRLAATAMHEASLHLVSSLSMLCTTPSSKATVRVSADRRQITKPIRTLLSQAMFLVEAMTAVAVSLTFAEIASASGHLNG